MSEAMPNQPAVPAGTATRGSGSSRRVVAVVALVVLAALAVWYFAVREPEPRNDLERFQGEWRITVAAGGQKRGTDNAVRVSGDRWESITPATSRAYRVAVNESASPKQIDLELLDTAGLRGAPVKMHGIYSFDGNRSARVVMGPANEPRPTNLDDPEGTVWLLTKVKLEEKAPPEN